jgi:hypothetical protein
MEATLESIYNNLLTEFSLTSKKKKQENTYSFHVPTDLFGKPLKIEIEYILGAWEGGEHDFYCTINIYCVLPQKCFVNFFHCQHDIFIISKLYSTLYITEMAKHDKDKNIAFKKCVYESFERMKIVKEALQNKTFIFNKKKFQFENIVKLEDFQMKRKIQNLFCNIFCPEPVLTCCICYEDGAQTTECGHLVCFTCLTKIKPKICPMCREKIIFDFKKVYKHIISNTVNHHLVYYSDDDDDNDEEYDDEDDEDDEEEYDDEDDEDDDDDDDDEEDDDDDDDENDDENDDDDDDDDEKETKEKETKEKEKDEKETKEKETEEKEKEEP